MRDSIKPLIIFGCSGAAKEIFYLIKQYNASSNDKAYDVLGFISSADKEIGTEVCDGVTVIASDCNISSILQKYKKVCAVIQFGNPQLKNKIIKKMKAFSSLEYPNIIHPNVTYEKDLVLMGEGNIIAAGTQIACNAEIGSFNLINRSCTIGHDFTLGSGNTINPGSIISGNVTVGDNCLLGAGSVILEKITICSDTVIGAGGVLTKCVTNPGVFVGVPARCQTTN